MPHAFHHHFKSIVCPFMATYVFKVPQKTTSLLNYFILLLNFMLTVSYHLLLVLQDIFEEEYEDAYHFRTAILDGVLLCK